MQQKVIHFNESDKNPHQILVWFFGKFPKYNISRKSTLLSSNMFANGEITIRCSNDIETHNYLKTEIFKNRNIHFIDDTTIPSKELLSKYDIVWFHDILFSCDIKPSFKSLNMEFIYATWITHNFHGSVYCLYADTVLPLIKNVISQKTNGNIHPMLCECKKTDLSNLHIVFNQDIISDWGKKRFDYDSFSNIDILPTICYVNMKIYFMLPEDYIFKPTQNKIPRGCYNAFFHESRVKIINKAFSNSNPKMLDISFNGKFIENMKSNKYYDSNCKHYFQNHTLAKMYDGFDYSIFLGRGDTKMPYLGSTIYEPFIYGMPLFCYAGSRESRVIFDGIKCFFRTEQELLNLINNTNFKELYEKQTERLKSYY